MPPEQGFQACMALFRYGLYNEMPDTKDNPMLGIFFKMAKPTIDAAMAKRVNGSKGGRKPLQKEENNKPINKSVNKSNQPPVVEDLPF